MRPRVTVRDGVRPRQQRCRGRGAAGDCCAAGLHLHLLRGRHLEAERTGEELLAAQCTDLARQGQAREEERGEGADEGGAAARHYRYLAPRLLLRTGGSGGSR